MWWMTKKAQFYINEQNKKVFKYIYFFHTLLVYKVGQSDTLLYTNVFKNIYLFICMDRRLRVLCERLDAPL